MKKNRVWAGILFAVCILLSLIGIWKSVYVSADIDESYAFTMAVRIAGGERMFIDLWEPHLLPLPGHRYLPRQDLPHPLSLQEKRYPAAPYKKQIH